MTENTLYGDTNFLHASVATTYSPVKIISSTSSPGIDFASSSVTTPSGIMGMHTGVDPSNNPVVAITSMNSSGTSYNSLFIVSQDGTVTTPKYSGSSSGVITTDNTGKFATYSSLPPTLGGTGLTSVPSANTLLGSNGTAIIPITAGSGITISGGVISTTASTPTNTQWNTAEISTPLSITTINDAGIWVVDYRATSVGIQSVFTINVPTGTVYSVRILSARKAGTVTQASQLGSATQFFSLYNVSNSVSYNQFGNNSNTGKNSYVVPTNNPTVGSTVSFAISLDANDRWRGLIEIVAN